MKGMRLPLVKDKYGTIVDQNGETPVVSGFALSCGRSSAMVEPRTDFIVRAVNSHDVLVEALELAKLGFEATIEDGRCGDTFVAMALSLDKINIALAAAKGEDNV